MHSTTIRRLGLFAVLAAALGLIAFFSFGGSASAQEGTPVGQRFISVSGNGTVYGPPDTVFLGLGVDRVDADLEAAVSGARGTLSEVVAALREAGVAENDIQTAYYNIFPEDRYNPTTGQPTGERVFRVSLGLNVTVRDVENASTVITAALNAGATSVNNVTFGIADPTSLESDARTAAVENARQRAEQLAEAFGVSLGEVISVRENAQAGILPPQPITRADMGMGAGGNNQIVPGQLSVTLYVEVTFAIEGAGN